MEKKRLDHVGYCWINLWIPCKLPAITKPLAQEQFFQAPIGLEDRAPGLQSRVVDAYLLCIKKSKILLGGYSMCGVNYKDGCLPVATPKKINMMCDYFDMNLLF